MLVTYGTVDSLHNHPTNQPTNQPVQLQVGPIVEFAHSLLCMLNQLKGPKVLGQKTRTYMLMLLPPPPLPPPPWFHARVCKTILFTALLRPHIAKNSCVQTLGVSSIIVRSRSQNFKYLQAVRDSCSQKSGIYTVFCAQALKTMVFDVIFHWAMNFFVVLFGLFHPEIHPFLSFFFWSFTQALLGSESLCEETADVEHSAFSHGLFKRNRHCKTLWARFFISQSEKELQFLKVVFPQIMCADVVPLKLIESRNRKWLMEVCYQPF